MLETIETEKWRNGVTWLWSFPNSLNLFSVTPFLLFIFSPFCEIGMPDFVINYQVAVVILLLVDQPDTY